MYTDPLKCGMTFYKGCLLRIILYSDHTTSYLNIRFPCRDGIISQYSNKGGGQSFPKKPLTRLTVHISP